MGEPVQEQAMEEKPVAEGKPVAEEEPDRKKGLKTALAVLLVLISLYIFLIGLSIMGSSFKVLCGRGASSVFASVDNPLSGLMAGILATVLVQSSSTSTSIVVAMVAEGALSVKNAIPVIMGANIGTSVTNTIVSLGQMGDPVSLERAFAGATVHDMFNMLTVITLLPIEAIVAALQGEGGILYWISYAITESLMGGGEQEELFDSPIKVITAPVANSIIKANKYVIYALTLTKPEEFVTQSVNETVCQPITRRLDTIEEDTPRRAAALKDCSKYACLSKSLDGKLEDIDEDAHAEFNNCDGIMDNGGVPCGDNLCYLDVMDFYTKKVTKGQLVKGGFLEGAGDVGGGIVGLVISILILCLGLFGLTKSLQFIFMGQAKKIIRYSLKLNDYLAILIGIGITIVVQSSSVTTSALTPLCGLGVLPLSKMLPLTLGANIGTCVTAMPASLVSLKFNGVQIAFCHLFFNIFGILFWFPIPPMRRLPLGAAELLGMYAAQYRFVPGLYILVMFLILPAVCFGIGALFAESIGGGVVLLLLFLTAIGVFEYAWIKGLPGMEPLCYKVMSEEVRRKTREDLEASNAEISGIEPSAEPVETEAKESPVDTSV